MNAVLADSVGLLALWNRDDQWHQAAADAFRALNAARTPFQTTTFVLLECGNSAARTSFRDKVCQLREKLVADQALIEPTPSDWELAWLAFERGEAGNAGIVDHISFQVMRRLGITHAFTNDGHFRAAGFETLF
jgi:uncharacterized protein